MQNQDTPIDLPTLIQQTRAHRDRVITGIISAALVRTANALTMNRRTKDARAEARLVA